MDFIGIIWHSEDKLRNDEGKGLGPDNVNIRTGEHGHTWGSYTTRAGHRVDYETSVYEISNVISPEEWEA